MSQVVLHRHSAKYLKRLPKDAKEQVKETLRRLQQNPLEQHGVKHMFGEWAGYHRMRVGKLRVIFWYDEKRDIVYVDNIGPRGDVYK